MADTTGISYRPRGGQARRLRSAKRGGVLFTVVILMLAAAVVGASVLNTAMNALRLAYRNDMRAQMTSIADSELEWLFFNLKMAVMSGTAMADLGDSSRITGQADVAETPTTIRSPYLPDHQTAGWRVQRSIRHLLSTRGTDTSNGGSRKALLDYIEAKIVVLPPASGSYANLPTVRLGRYFVSSQSTIFQYGVFFDGVLELNPAETYTLNGDIYASGNAFLGPNNLSGVTLTVNENAKLRLVSGNTLNGSSDSDVAGSTYYNPDAKDGVARNASQKAPLFALTGSAAPGAQLEELTKEENLLGGLDALATAQARPDLFGPAGKSNVDDFPPENWSASEQAEAVNNVKRSLIVPPPSSASSAEYPNNPSSDDPAISVQRAYNRAGLIVTVASNGSVTVQKQTSGGSLTDVTSTYMAETLLGSIMSDPIASSAPINVYDSREAKTVKVTEIDIAELSKKLSTYGDFNGLLYINLQNSSSTAPAAVRLVNAEDVPVTSGGVGLSVATNGGLYVKGSYNATPVGTNADGTPVYAPSMLMADAITVLSYAWDDANASSTNIEGDKAASVDNPATADNPITPFVNENVVETSIDINAGLVTGNTPSTSTSASGGAQNLVRYLEAWTGNNVNFYGSLGRVFASAHFKGAFNNNVYRPPLRTVTYDSNLAAVPPAGSPILTGFSRGDVFRF